MCGQKVRFWKSWTVCDLCCLKLVGLLEWRFSPFQHFSMSETCLSYEASFKSNIIKLIVWYLVPILSITASSDVVTQMTLHATSRTDERCLFNWWAVNSQASCRSLERKTINWCAETEQRNQTLWIIQNHLSKVVTWGVLQVTRSGYSSGGNFSQMCTWGVLQVTRSGVSQNIKEWIRNIELIAKQDWVVLEQV